MHAEADPRGMPNWRVALSCRTAVSLPCSSSICGRLSTEKALVGRRKRVIDFGIRAHAIVLAYPGRRSANKALITHVSSTSPLAHASSFSPHNRPRRLLSLTAANLS